MEATFMAQIASKQTQQNGGGNIKGSDSGMLTTAKGDENAGPMMLELALAAARARRGSSTTRSGRSASATTRRRAATLAAESVGSDSTDHDEDANGTASTDEAPPLLFTSVVANVGAAMIKTGMFDSLEEFHLAFQRQTIAQMDPGKRFRIPPGIETTCSSCGEPARCICPVCLEELYCGRSCQFKSWATHSQVCEATKKDGPIATAEHAVLSEVNYQDSQTHQPCARKPMKTEPAAAPRSRSNTNSTNTTNHRVAAAKVASAPLAAAVAKSRVRYDDTESGASDAFDYDNEDVIPGLFRCDIPDCGKVFKQSSSLKSHARIHTGEKPFNCTFKGCNKGFSASFALRRHERIHTGEKSFKCGSCSKTFSRKDALKQHMRVHGKGGKGSDHDEDDGEDEE